MSTRRHGDVVPFTEAEWYFVKQNLRSNNPAALRSVVNVLNMWESRVGASCPVVIKLTKVVLQGIAFDLQNCHQYDAFNEDSCRLIFGTVIMRFVSYLNEICQPATGPLKSVFDATRSIGIPQWLVQMRHNIAHSDLPELDELRRAAGFCVCWLWDIHWKQPVEVAITVPGRPASPPPAQPDPQVVEELKGLVNTYCTVTLSRTKDATELAVNARKLHHVCEGFSRIIRESPHLFIVGVVKRLALSLDQIKQSGFTFNCQESGPKVWPIPAALAKFWHNLIVLMEDCHCFGAFLNKIVSQVSDASVPFLHKSQYAGWTLLFLDRIMVTLSDYDLKKLVENVMDGCHFFQRDHFVKLLHLLGDRISAEKRDEHLALWDIRACQDTDAGAETSADESVQVLSLDSLTPVAGGSQSESASPPHALRGPGEPAKKKKKKNKYKEWSLVECQLSLGLLPHQSSETLDLRFRTPAR